MVDSDSRRARTAFDLEYSKSTTVSSHDNAAGDPFIFVDMDQQTGLQCASVEGKTKTNPNSHPNQAMKFMPRRQQ